jgi:ketosteroid isomerase-like protein
MNLRHLVVPPLCLLVMLTAGAGYADPGADDPRLARLEERRTHFKAAFLAADVPVLESIVAPHYTHTNDKSEPLDREGWLDTMRRRQDSDSRITRFDSEYFPLKVHGDTAVVTGITRLRGIRDGSEYGILINFTHVWEWDGGEWYRIAFHDTYQPLEP